MAQYPQLLYYFPGGGLLLPSSRVSGVCPEGMVLDEIDTCIITEDSISTDETFHSEYFLDDITISSHRVNMTIY